MPAWNQRYREIQIWGLPATLLLALGGALAALALALAMLAGGNLLVGALMLGLALLAGQETARKIGLGKRRPFDRTFHDNRQFKGCRYNDGFETEIPQMRDYEQRKLPLRLHHGCMLNNDGSVSIALRFAGFSLYLDRRQRRLARETIRSALQELGKGFVLELHLCRQADHSQSEAYRQYPIVRQHTITRWIRDRIADGVAQREYANSVFVVITSAARQRGWIGAARSLKEQPGKIERLWSFARLLQSRLPQAEIDTLGAYRHMLALVNNSQIGYAVDSAEQCCGWFAGGRAEECDAHGGMLRLADGRYVKSLWFEEYPDAAVGFVCRLLSAPASVHLVQAIRPVSVYDRQAVQRDINISASMASGANVAGARIKLAAHNEMQSWCAEGDHDVYWNFYAMQIIGRKPADIAALAARLGEWVGAQGGVVRDYPEIQLAAWHYLLPGSAGWARRWRIDESEQLAGMAPVHVPRRGAKTPLSLRLSTQHTPVNIGYERGDIAHHVTIAMTGAGKSLDRCARILESYGVGIDIYALEIGQSLWWAIEAIGGQYHRLDPDEVMVNPLPDRSCCLGNGLPIEILTTTATALTMLLTPKPALDQFELTATQLAIQGLYREDAPDAEPDLGHLHQRLLAIDHKQAAIPKAARRLGAHLGAFLESAEGRRLMELPQLSIKAGAVGCDLGKIKEKTPRMLKFYLIFVALRYSQLAFANNNPAEIVLDEMHEFVRQAPDVIGALIDGIARMGRKHANYINLITQEESEIEAIGASVLNQTLRKCLLYKQSGHAALGERIAMPADACRAWRAWRNPLSLSHRYALECTDGEQWHELLLRFPEEIAILSRTDPLSLDCKRIISAECKDPIERIRRCREMIEERQARR